MHGHACTNCDEAYPGFEPRCPKCDPCPRCSPPKLASFAQAGHTLTEADVERVARRVVEMLGERLK